MAEIFPNSSRTPATLNPGDAVQLTWDATADLGIYFYEGSVVKPDGTFFVYARRYTATDPFPKLDSFTDTLVKGSYSWTSRYADDSIRTGIDLTYGVGFKDEVLTWFVNGLAQSTPSLTPNTGDITAGQSITFFASGGQGIGAYVWGGVASGGGSSKLVTFPTAGTYQVTLYRLGDTTYDDSAVATATINVVSLDPQPPTVITPPSASIVAGASILFTASGGSGTGQYVWGGWASGTGTTKLVAFSGAGTYQVTLYRQGDGTHLTSATTAATITVTSNSQSLVVISPTFANCNVGESILFTASGGSGTGQYVWTGSGDGIGATKLVTFPLAGVYEVHLYRNGDTAYAASNVAVASVTVSPLQTANPVFTPPGGSYLSAQVVTITSTTLGAHIRYTTDGSNPSPSSGTLFTGPLVINHPQTLRALAYVPGAPNSAIVNATYDIPPDPPQVTIDATVLQGPAPLATTISWSATGATSVVVSGPNLASAQASGSQLFSNLDVGSYTFSIMAFNAGGSATAQVSVAAIGDTIDFYIFGTKTVKFTDKTIYRADHWSWDFGDGFTSEEENPIHTYGLDGIFVVKLTAFCDGIESTKIHTVLISGCFTADPLPYTPDWETLGNEQLYPAWDDPRFTPDELSNDELGFVESREGLENENWAVCSYVDWCTGPDVAGEVQYRFKRRWMTYLDPNSKLWTYGRGSPSLAVPIELFPEYTANPSYFNTVNFISLSFDERALPYFAFQKGTSQIQVRYYDTDGSTRKTVIFTGETPKLFGESNLQPASGLTDVCCFYLRNGTIYVRFERENFGIEHVMQTPSVYGGELAVLTKVDDVRANDNRRIYLYGYTVGNRKILLRSKQYPIFPSETGTAIFLDDAGAETVTLSGGTDRVAEVEFSTLSTTLDGGYLYDPREPATQQTTLDDSHTTDLAELSSQATSLEVGSHTPQVDLATEETTLDQGYINLADVGYSTQTSTLVSGAHLIRVDKAIQQLSIDQGGSHSRRVERTTETMTLVSGAHALRVEKTLSTFALERGSHTRRVEQVVERQTFDKGRHLKADVGKTTFTLALNGANHRQAEPNQAKTTIGLVGGSHVPFVRPFQSSGFLTIALVGGSHTPDYGFKATLAGTHGLEGGSHVLRDEPRVSGWFTLERGSHTPPAIDALVLGPTLDNGSHGSVAERAGVNVVSLGSATHYFQVFTFDYNGSDPTVDPSQDDHWDSTNRSFDLDIVISPDIA